MNIFERVKAAVAVREAAEAYGMSVTRSGMTCCPFHGDRTPSMKLNDTYYYCFGCQAHGDVIDLTAGLFRTGLRDAAERLAADFGVPLVYGYSRDNRIQRESAAEAARRAKESENRCFAALSDYLHVLRGWRKRYQPTGESGNGTPHPRFTEACRMYEAVEYMVDTLATGEEALRRALVADMEADDKIGRLERYLRECGGGDG